ncbi:MAG: hypothetical protein NC123_15610 [Butyrivibrio sp.]|nr:hypothetical protein [Acetatifactor muris]MCM1560946.1 hypothetical protein [Butyrivibrio sp.]
MRSIMQEKQDHTCYLCMMLHSDFSEKQTQEHHVIFGTANRRLSEKYGLKVYLCMAHHEEGREAVHRNAVNALILKKAAQKAFEKRWPELDFRQIFGKNFLGEEDIPVVRQQASRPGKESGSGKEAGPAAGFRFLDTGLETMDMQ